LGDQTGDDAHTSRRLRRSRDGVRCATMMHEDRVWKSLNSAIQLIRTESSSHFKLKTRLLHGKGKVVRIHSSGSGRARPITYEKSGECEEKVRSFVMGVMADARRHAPVRRSPKSSPRSAKF